jgi:hypothetical protein
MCEKLFAHIFIDFDVLLYSKGNRSKLDYSQLFLYSLLYIETCSLRKHRKDDSKANEIGCYPSTLRNYGVRGLFISHRDRNGFRYFMEEDLKKLIEIRYPERFDLGDDPND